MIYPYEPNPTHKKNPTKPVSIDGIGTFCGCDDCTTARNRWAEAQEPLLTELDPNDGEDNNTPS